MSPKPQDHFDVKGETARLRQENEGVKFHEKVEDALKCSVQVRTEIKTIFWEFFKERIGWILGGAVILVAIELLRELISHMISKI